MTSPAKNFSWLDVPKSIWYFLEEDKKKFLVAFFVLSTIFLYDLVPAYMVGRIVDFFTSHQAGQSLRVFYWYCVILGGSWILAALIRSQSKRMLGHIRTRTRTRTRVWGFERLTEFSLEWHNKENTGSKLQKIYTGSDAISKFLILMNKDLLRIAINSTAVILFFLFSDFKIFCLTAIYTIIFFFISSFFGKKILVVSNEYNISNQVAGGIYVESASNMLAIKALGSEKGVISRVQNREVYSRELGIRKVNLSNTKWRIINVLNGISLGIFLFLTGSAFLSGVISLGSILIFYSYYDRMGRAFVDLDEIYIDLIDSRSDIGNMMPIFTETEFIKRGNESFPKDWDKIEIKNAKMDYGSGQMGLQDFNLTLKRNTKTGVAGLSGSGKSTLAKIILGLYALKSGGFKIGKENNMKNYYSISHNETLGHITVVLQETELFNLSLRENITMMRGEDAELLNQAIEISQLKEIIERLPEGLDAKIGEKGYMLSGGERQRLGIARAIYKNAPIVILDEATSSLDSETEGKIMEKLLGKYGQDKTFLIIAHRLGTLKYTDNIAVMERGRVSEEGSYDKLMEDPSSVFYRMNNLSPTLS